jgi:hypothetical protein
MRVIESFSEVMLAMFFVVNRSETSAAESITNPLIEALEPSLWLFLPGITDRRKFIGHRRRVELALRRERPFWAAPPGVAYGITLLASLYYAIGHRS